MFSLDGHRPQAVWTHLIPVGSWWLHTQETVLPPLSPSHMLGSHNFLSLGGIPSTFWEQRPSVQSIPTDSFSGGYGTCEKPNDIPGSPRETLSPGALPPRMSHTYHLAGGARGPGLRSPPFPGGGENWSSSEVSADGEGRRFGLPRRSGRRAGPEGGAGPWWAGRAGSTSPRRQEVRRRSR